VTAIETVRVELGARAYAVHIGAQLIEAAGAHIAPLAAGGRKLFVVTDETVARLHLARLEASLREARLTATTLELPPGEAQKSFAGLERVCRWLVESGAERRDLVVAFGGGVIGDLAGLAAGLLKRGMDFIQIPTTLLAQVDSSVGGKTAIDMPEGKNLVGLFHQPLLVLADLDVLATLPARERLAGYAEIVKYGLIDLPDFYEHLEACAGDLLRGDRAVLADAVRRSVEAKARIVADDERESGARALLNLGHTFAHALETVAGYDGELLHGEAVGVGLGLAFGFSAHLGFCDGQEAVRVRRHLAAAGFHTHLSQLPGAPHDPDRLADLMAMDKKAEGGKLTFVLAHGIGRAFVAKDVPRAEVVAFLRAELIGADPIG
jgi:3-dehydroquinate synthase